jgi:glycine amidinotransferase
MKPVQARVFVVGAEKLGKERSSVSASPVNSYTEWGPLREIIVGEVDNGYVPTRLDYMDLSYKLFYNDNLVQHHDNDVDGPQAPGLGLETVAPYATREAEERREDVEAFVGLLEQLGITVRRPRRMDTLRPVATPAWSSLSHFAHNVRDQTLIVGEEIIETPPLCRHRYFENDLLKPLYHDYFKRGAKWTVAPRPLMLDESFDKAYVKGAPQAEVKGGGQLGFEMMFDAAQCLRFGADLVMNVSTENHRLGARWLQSHLGDRFRVHVMEGFADNHIDGTIMPLRPGVLFVNARKIHGRAHKLPEALRKWDMITCYDTDETAYSEDRFLLASEYISANVLPLDEERVVVDAHSTKTIHTLEKHGFTPIPITLRHSRLYAGGFHCITLDVRREESLETYF